MKSTFWGLFKFFFVVVFFFYILVFFFVVVFFFFSKWSRDLVLLRDFDKKKVRTHVLCFTYYLISPRKAASLGSGVGCSCPRISSSRLAICNREYIFFLRAHLVS